MFRLIDGDEVTLITIDPGTNTCGFSITTVNLATRQITIADAYTVKGNGFITKQKDFVAMHGDKEAKLNGYHKHLYTLCMRHEPYLVASEAPFFGRFAAAGLALTKQVYSFRMAVRAYDKWCPMLLVEPTTLKKFMKTKGNSKDKSLMHNALKARQDILYGDHLDVKSMDEHTVDAICVSLNFAEKILCLIETKQPIV